MLSIAGATAQLAQPMMMMMMISDHDQ